MSLKFRFLIVQVCLFSFILFSQKVFGGGFMIYEHSALATGMADARTAIFDDPSALWYNPAGITLLDGFHISLGDTLIFPKNTYKPLPENERTHGDFDGVNPAHGEFQLFYPLHFYFTASATKWLTVGIGVNNPFGLGTSWPENWDGRFTAYRTNLRTFFVQPAMAVNFANLLRLPDKVIASVAVGVDYVYGDATIEQKLDFSYFGAQEPGDMKLEGSGHGLGANYALLVGWLPWFTFGASFRSNVHLTFKGEAKFSDIDESISYMLQFPESTGGRTSIELPWNMNFGLAFYGLKKFIFAADFYVVLWDSYDELRVKFDCSTSGECNPDLNANAVYPKNWHTGYQFSLGAEYHPIKAVAIRLGYGYVTDPTDPKYYDAMLPDGNRHLICVGAGYRAPKYFKIDAGYMLALWKGTKNNEVGAPGLTGYNGYANGTYETISHLFAITLGFNFSGKSSKETH